MPAPYVFISYKTEDLDYVKDLVQALAAVGLESWAGFKDIRQSHANEIPQAIEGASAFVVLMSREACSSPEVVDEVFYARGIRKEPRLPTLLPSEVHPYQFEGVPQRMKQKWGLELAQHNYQLWGSAQTVAARAVRAIADEASAATEAPGSSAILPPSDTDAPPVREPLALVSSLGLTYQLDGRHGLGQELLTDGGPIRTRDPGQIVLAPDGSVIATLNRELEVEIWTLGSRTSLPGPPLSDVPPPGAGTVRLLAIDRPIGQAIRIVASRGSTAYSVMEGRDGTWVSTELATGGEEFVGGAAVADDLLLVQEGGDTVWAGDHAKRPFSLRTVRGVDSAFGPDGRQYLAGWGRGTDGSPQVEAVVESEVGWEKLHRGPGDRAGIIRVLHDAARQGSAPDTVAIAIQSASNEVELLPIGA